MLYRYSYSVLGGRTRDHPEHSICGGVGAPTPPTPSPI